MVISVDDRIDGRRRDHRTLAATVLVVTTVVVYVAQLLLQAVIGIDRLQPGPPVVVGTIAMLVGLGGHALLAGARGYLSAMWPGLIFPAFFCAFHFGTLGDLPRGWFNEAYLPFAWILCVTCLLCWLCGHSLGRGRDRFSHPTDTRASVRSQPLSHRQLRLLAITGAIVFGVAFTAQIVLLSRAGVGNILTADYQSFKRAIHDAGMILAAANFFSMLLAFVGLSLSWTASALADRKLFVHPALTVGFALYAGLLVLTGDRSELIVVTLALVVTRHYLVANYRFRQVAIFTVIAAVLFAGLRVYRGTKNVDDFVTNATDPKSLVFDNGDETGGTLDTVIRSMELVPERFDYFRGYTYYSAIVRIVPKVVVPAGPDFVSSVWLTEETTKARDVTTHGVGFSVVAEAYINFGGSLAPLVLLAFGWIQGRVERWMVGPDIDPRYFTLFLLVQAAFILHVRNSVVHYFRGSIWAAVLVFGLFAVYWALWGTPRRAQEHASGQA